MTRSKTREAYLARTQVNAFRSNNNLASLDYDPAKTTEQPMARNEIARLYADPRQLNARNITGLQRVIGNQAVQEIIARKRSYEKGSPAPAAIVTPPKQVQRLVAANTFRKKTTLTARPGKSKAFFQAVTAALNDYQQGEVAGQGTGAKLGHLKNLLAMLTDWINNRGAKSQRKKYIDSLKNEVITEISGLESTLKDIKANTFSDKHHKNVTPDAVGGQMNRLDEIEYDFGVVQVEGDNGEKIDKKEAGGTFQAYFKANVAQDPKIFAQTRAAAAGIKADDTRYSERNRALYELDKLLGGGLIPPTFAAKNGNKIGLAIQKVEGITAADHLRLMKRKAEANDDVEYRSILDSDDNGVLKRGLSNLYLLDIIAGMVDRHYGNFIVEKKGDVIVGVKGIDNDDAFGTEYEDINYTKQNKFANNLSAGKAVQDLEGIDMAYAQRIVNLNQNNGVVVAALSELLTKEEVTKTLTRLASLAKFLQQLLNDNSPIIKANWD